MRDGYIEKDKKSGAILNTDNSGLARYKESKKKYADLKNKINTLEDRLNKLEEIIK